MTQQPPPTSKSVQGTIDRVPCPHCGKPNDFRILQSQQLLDTGGEHFCDHCGFSMVVVAIRQIEMIAVRKNPKGGRAPVANAAATKRRQLAAQTAQKPGLLQRLLGAPKGR